MNKKEFRKQINSNVLIRDGYKCVICKISNCKLDVHHIMDRHYFDNGGYSLSNLITLCEECHLKAEEYHKTNAQNYIKGYHPDDLYKYINSNFELAIRDNN